MGLLSYKTESREATDRDFTSLSLHRCVRPRLILYVSKEAEGSGINGSPSNASGEWTLLYQVEH